MPDTPLRLYMTQASAAALASDDVAESLAALIRDVVHNPSAGSPYRWSLAAARTVLSALAARTTQLPPLSSAVVSVLQERWHHLKTGHDAAHDDRLRDGQLAAMARWYVDESSSVAEWPWEDDWPRRVDRATDLIRAAALLLAEIDRLDRARAGVSHRAGTPPAGDP